MAEKLYVSKTALWRDVLYLIRFLLSFDFPAKKTILNFCGLYILFSPSSRRKEGMGEGRMEEHVGWKQMGPLL